MFKIKKSTKRVQTKNVLRQTNQNQETDQRQTLVRPQSVKYRTINNGSHEVFPKQLQFNSQVPNRSTTSLAQFRSQSIAHREGIEEEVRRLGAVLFKDKMAVYGQIKEDLIGRVVDKSMLRPQIWLESRTEEMRVLMFQQLQKVERVRQIQRRCEQRETRIQTLIEQRLSKLSNLR